MKDLLPLQEAIYEVGLLFSKSTQPSEAQINAYAKALQRYSPEQVTYAFNQIILKGSAFFPSLAEVLVFLRVQESSSEDRGNIFADEIVSKALDHGFYRTKDAYESLSNEAKLVIGNNTRILKEICESSRDELMIIKSQIRKLAVARINTTKNEIHNKQIESLIEGNKAKLKDLSGLRLMSIEEPQQKEG